MNQKIGKKGFFNDKSVVEKEKVFFNEKLTPYFYFLNVAFHFLTSQI